MYRTILLTSLILSAAFAWGQEIALTFDDAPTSDGPIFSGKQRTEELAHHLSEHGVSQAMFFVLTGNIDSDTRKRLDLYQRKGHLLANHSHTHPWIHQAGARGYARDVQTADSILRSFAAYVPMFRYPYLDEGRNVDARDSIRAALNSLQLRNGYVTIDNYDWYLNSLLSRATRAGKSVDKDVLRDIYIDHIYNSILFYDSLATTHLGRSPRHVLLLHENDLAAMFLGDLIKHLKKNGWKIISPMEAYGDPIASRVPDVLFNNQGRIAAIAREKGIPARDLVQLSEDEAFLDELVRKKRVFE